MPACSRPAHLGDSRTWLLVAFAIVTLLFSSGCGSSAAGGQPPPWMPQPHPSKELAKPGSPPIAQPDADSPFARDIRADAVLGRISRGTGAIRGMLDRARVEKDVVKVNCLNDKLNQLDVFEHQAREHRAALRGAFFEADANAEAPWIALVAIERRANEVRQQSFQCVGEEAAFVGESTMRAVSSLPGVSAGSGGAGDRPSRYDARVREIEANANERKKNLKRAQTRAESDQDTNLGVRNVPPPASTPTTVLSPPVDALTSDSLKTVQVEGPAVGKVGGTSGLAAGHRGSLPGPALVTKPPVIGAPPGGQAPAPGPSGNPPAPVARDSHDGSMLIRSAQLALAVFEVEKNVDAVEKIGSESGGYLALRGDRQITIRIPKDRFDEAVKRIEKLGDVLHRNVTAEDVTDQYVDVEMRLKNAKAVSQRLEKLLETATVKDAVEIHKELSKVTEEIERYEGKLKLLRDRISFSTITVTFEQTQSQQVRAQALLPFPWMRVMGLQPLLYVPR